MITPRFSCAQSSSSLIISVYCPAIRASDVEIHVDQNLFTLNINPYFLRLTFSHNLVDDDSSSAQYDPSSGYLTITLSKEVEGQEFKDLDLLASLLAPRRAATQPSIEVLSSDLSAQTDALSLEQQQILEGARNDWQVHQVPQSAELETSLQKHYGFLDMHSGYFRHVKYTENEVNELGGDAEVCSLHERQERRVHHENEKFDAEHYMADYADDDMIKDLLVWQHPFLIDHGAVEFTEQERLAMLRLPRREYIPTHRQTHNLYLILITLLFSYAYESRTTQCDPTPESAWTICTLTPAFSALDPPSYDTADDKSWDSFTYDEVRAVLIPSYRRSLAFPLYRSFPLAEACRHDVAYFLARGKRVVFRCLLEMKQILERHEVYYVYSKIWLDDFCVWTQTSAEDENLSRLGESVTSAKIEKSVLGWDLEALEHVADMADERERDSDDE
ncbi:hypothetical protein AMATHDRAFT_189553 [Amanita thiersii Skay4041]|uniref:CS domain-containing protein n=1 Tax=Amanita thiersii Skay4041 TaxID=703135 RepID=A0A2A9NX69_9AGAR|nr:hypothetical protein AMATHDRAFT_189553 [Amanita thiersii Skay4041]